ncbi:MAG: hypothetical protein ACRBEE_03160 [Arenicella sp.]
MKGRYQSWWFARISSISGIFQKKLIETCGNPQHTALSMSVQIEQSLHIFSDMEDGGVYRRLNGLTKENPFEDGVL